MFVRISKRFAVSTSFPGRKLLDVLVLVSLLLASCGPQTTNTVQIPESPIRESGQVNDLLDSQSDYVPSEHSHPEPVMGERVDNDDTLRILTQVEPQETAIPEGTLQIAPLIDVPLEKSPAVSLLDHLR